MYVFALYFLEFIHSLVLTTNLATARLFITTIFLLPEMSHHEALILAVQRRLVLWQKSHGGCQETTTRVENNWIDVAKKVNDAVGTNYDRKFCCEISVAKVSYNE